MKREEVDRCQIQEWYPKFKSVSFKTEILQLPEPFVEYLLDDSGPFVLPASVADEDAFPNRVHNPLDEGDFQVPEGSDDEDDSEGTPPPSFPDLELKVRDSIESLGGAVFPKLNWSSPKDAAWISPTVNLRCTTFSEIALLLRSSDSLVHDLCHAYDSCGDHGGASRPEGFFLALRKWQPGLRPDMEFRCFVKARQLVGICQREVTTFYPALLERKDELRRLIEEFFEGRVRESFESESYTFDVYVSSDRKVRIMDFNTWGASTLSLLFSWEELEAEEVGEVMRIVDGQCGVRPGLKTSVPYDYVDTAPGSGWDQFMQKADEELRQQKGESAGA